MARPRKIINSNEEVVEVVEVVEEVEVIASDEVEIENVIETVETKPTQPTPVQTKGHKPGTVIQIGKLTVRHN